MDAVSAVFREGCSITMPPVDIEAVVTDPSASAEVSVLLEIALEFSAYPDTIARLLGDPQAAARAMGVVRLANDLCAGAHTSLGCTIGQGALACLLEHGSALGVESDMLLGVQGALASALANALHLEGRFEETVALVDDLPGTVPALEENEAYWNAAAIAVRTLVRRFDLETAITRIECIPERFHGVPQYALARTELDKAVQQRFQVPPPRTLHEKHADVWLSAIAGQRTMLESIRADLARAPPEAAHLSGVDADIDSAIGELERFSARLDDLHEITVLRDEMLGTLRRFNALMLRVQNVRPDRVDTAGLFAVDRVLERAQWHLELGAVSDQDFDDIDRQRRWCAERGDLHGELMLHWIGALLAMGTERSNSARERFVTLLDTLENAIAQCASEDDRGRLANYFYDLPAKVFDRFGSNEPGEVFRAAEVRKGRTLLSMRASSAPLGEIEQPERLGARTHYLAVTVLEDTARVLLTFYGANGRVDTAEAAVAPEAIRRAAARLAPDRWRERELFGPPSAALPETLRPLLAPLEAALERGDVLEGDHVCLAADDPVSLMPLQIARLGDGRCVNHVSLSRVTSFRDAEAIVRTPVVRPNDALLVSIPVDERRGEEKAMAVARIARGLGTLGLAMERLDGPIAHAALLRAVERHRLIHIDAHGFFPSARDGAFERAGLLVPETSEARSRRATPDRILSSSAIERAALDLSGAHVTLNACVSGVGLPGQGGDILGLELALRLKGAASVLATHWDVRWPLSAVFLERFYRRWLDGRHSRAAAWRHAMLDAMADSSVTVSRAEEWGAFALYGDWR